MGGGAGKVGGGGASNGIFVSTLDPSSGRHHLVVQSPHRAHVVPTLYQHQSCHSSARRKRIQVTFDYEKVAH